MNETAHVPGAVREPGFWYGSELEEADWRLPIPDEVLAELEAATHVHAPPKPDLPATAAFAAEVRHRLFHGCGVAVAGRMPFEKWGEDRAWRAVALMSGMVGRRVRQTMGGTTLYAVEDEGVKAMPGVRRSRTNVPQAYHCDGPWVSAPPWVVSLYAVRRARFGGVSRCISLRSLFADFASISPVLHDRLRRDFCWHRQGEHAEGESPVSRLPVIWHDERGRWCSRFYADYVFAGYRAAGEEIDDEARQALEELTALSEEPFRRLEFVLDGGEIEWVNNRWCAHSRTGFEPSADTDRPRLLVRVWHREAGDPVALDT